MVKLFQEKPFKNVIKTSFTNIERKVDNLSEYRILNENSDKLTEEIYKYAKLTKLQIDFEDREVNVEMVDLPAKNFPPQYDVRPGKSYPCAQVSYTFSVRSGDIALLSVSPFKYGFTKRVLISVSGNTFTIPYQTLYGNQVLSDEIKKEVKNSIKAIIDEMKITLSSINQDIEEFNMEVKPKIESLIENRKKNIQAKNSQNNDLNNL